MNLASITRIGKRVSAFVGGQGSVQALNAAAGLVLLRLLSKPEFAMYAVALGVQSMITVLTEVGFSGAIIGLTGTRHREKEVLGRYIYAASAIRRGLVLVVTFIAFAAVILLRNTRFESHGGTEIILLAIAVLVTLQFQAWTAYYEAPLLLHTRLVAFYTPQVGSALCRLAGVFVLYYLHIISAVTVIWVNTAMYVATGVAYRVMARPWITLPRRFPREQAREMIRYLAPLVPMYIYTALQGQISLFLITIFGHMSQIAEVAAASRIGQIFLLLGTSNTVLVMPFFAKTPRAQFYRRLVYALSATATAGIAIAASAWLFPEIYLFILGSKYRNLTYQVQLVVYSAAVGYFLNSMWAIASARKWVFWWSGTLQVVVLTVVQAVCVILLPLNTSEGVLKMNLFTAFGALAVQVAYLIQGLSIHARAGEEKAVAS